MLDLHTALHGRKLRQAEVLQPVDAQFNRYNSYSAVDVNVTLLVRADLSLFSALWSVITSGRNAL